MSLSKSSSSRGGESSYFREVAPDKLWSEIQVKASDSRFTRDYCDKVWTWITKFCEELLNDDIKLLVPSIARGGFQSYDFSPLANRFYFHIPEMIELASLLSDRNIYDEYTELFLSCCTEMGLSSNGLLKNKELWYVKLYEDSLNEERIACANLVNNMAEYIRREGRLRKSREKNQDRKREAKRSIKANAKYFNTLSRIYPKLIAIRVDLFYRQMVGIPPNLEDLNRHLEIMLANSRSNKTVFGGKVGHLAKIEYGVRKGPHLHLVIFFDGAERDFRRHWNLANAIGEYWKDVITKGQGDYYNCHTDYPLFEMRGVCGIGLLHRDDEQRKSNFRRYVLMYLCKLNSFAKPRNFPGMRLIRRGVITKKMERKLEKPWRHPNPSWQALEEEPTRYREFLSKLTEIPLLVEPMDGMSRAMLEKHLHDMNKSD